MIELADRLRRLADQLAGISDDRDHGHEQLMNIHDELLAATSRLAASINEPACADPPAT